MTRRDIFCRHLRRASPAKLCPSLGHTSWRWISMNLAYPFTNSICLKWDFVDVSNLDNVMSNE